MWILQEHRRVLDLLAARLMDHETGDGAAALDVIEAQHTPEIHAF